MNPFMQPFSNEYGVPPFNLIKKSHYAPAIRAGIALQKKEIKVIIDNPDIPTFENTIEAIENSGQIIQRTASVMYNLSYADTNERLQKIIEKIAPGLSAHQDQIYMNIQLFCKVKSLWGDRKRLKLSGEKKRLLEHYYNFFVKNGANLSRADKKIISKINQELTLLNLRFGQNIMAEINEYKLIISEINDLSGLPEMIISEAKAAAIAAHIPDKWVFTLQHSSVISFLQYAENRSLRKEIWTAYTNRGNNGNKNDNGQIAKEIVRLRAEKSKILGFGSHAHYVLKDQMAKSPDHVQALLSKLWKPALLMAKKEARALQKIIERSGQDVKLAAYDWRYYAEKLRKKTFDLDESEFKPYFSLENVKNGVFDVATSLYGLKFEAVNYLPTYHKDAKAYLVTESDGKKVGILYCDFFPRTGKQGGAWMTSFVEQKKQNLHRVLPVISIVCNFTKPLGNTPSLLTFDEVATLFHEFGHALHGLLSEVTYASLGGTNVPTDFVELPSQIMENWASEPEVLKSYAKHYITNHIIPESLILKLESSSKYGQGFATIEYLAASMLDMAYHSLSENMIKNINEFELTFFSKIGLIPEIVSRYRSTYFSHIFAGGYAAGYYSYIWSEVLDADAFSLFKANGIFDKKTALSFRKNILARGGTVDPMKLYVKFRGQNPKIEPLLLKRGLEI